MNENHQIDFDVRFFFAHKSVFASSARSHLFVYIQTMFTITDLFHVASCSFIVTFLILFFIYSFVAFSISLFIVVSFESFSLAFVSILCLLLIHFPISANNICLFVQRELFLIFFIFSVSLVAVGQFSFLDKQKCANASESRKHFILFSQNDKLRFIKSKRTLDQLHSIQRQNELTRDHVDFYSWFFSLIFDTRIKYRIIDIDILKLKTSERATSEFLSVLSQPFELSIRDRINLVCRSETSEISNIRQFGLFGEQALN